MSTCKSFLLREQELVCGLMQRIFSQCEKLVPSSSLSLALSDLSGVYFKVCKKKSAYSGAPWPLLALLFGADPQI